MHDPQYRLSVAWQNVAYNQPTHTGFYLGDGMATPPRPSIRVSGARFQRARHVEDVPPRAKPRR